MPTLSGRPGGAVAWLSCWLLAAGAGAGLAAQDPESAPAAPQAAVPDSALALALGRIAGQPLTLEQALLAAAEGSTEAREARAELDAARAAVRRERGGFDPELFGEWRHAGREQPTASFFAGADVLETDETVATAGARWRLRWGTELTATLDSRRREDNNAFSSLHPQYDAAGSLALRQPLLRGFGAAAAGELTAAERSLEAARARQEDAVLAVRAGVEGAYWDLHAAARDHAVQQLVREQARVLLAEATTRVRAGLAGPGQAANARVFLAEQEQAVLDRQEQLDRASDRLATLIGQRPPGGAPRWLAADEPPRAFPPADQQRLVEAALRGNHQLRAAERAVAALAARARAGERDALPRLDLFGSLGGSGLAGTGREIVLPFGAEPETVRVASTGGRGESLDQVLGRDYPDWSVGVSFALPLGNRALGGERDRRRAEAARAEHQLEAARRALADRVRAGARELEHGEARLAAAREGVAAAQEQVRIGMLEYRHGRSTAFEVARLGADLAAAQQRYSQALVRVARAVAELRRLTAGAYPGEENAQ